MVKKILQQQDTAPSAPEPAGSSRDTRPPAGAWIGVQALTLPDLLVESEAQAVTGLLQLG